MCTIVHIENVSLWQKKFSRGKNGRKMIGFLVDREVLVSRDSRGRLAGEMRLLDFMEGVLLAE